MLAMFSDCPKLYVKLSQVYLPMLYGTQENEKKVIKILILISIIKMTSVGLCLIISICQKLFYYSYMYVIFSPSMIIFGSTELHPPCNFHISAYFCQYFSM